MIGLFLACLAAGCAIAPTGKEANDEEQVRALLARFQEGVQKDDVALLMSLYSPQLPADQREDERERLDGAMRSMRYSGYAIRFDPKHLALPHRALRDGQLTVEVSFSKPGGKHGKDTFVLRREGDRWFLVRAGLDKPGKGDDVDLSPPEHETLVAAVEQCNQAILSRDMDALVTRLSQGTPPAKRNEAKKKLADLLGFHKCQYFSSSFSRSGLEMKFGSKGEIAVPLDFMYVRHDGTRGERKLRLRFRRVEGEWRLAGVEQRDNPLWKSFGKVAVPLLLQGARHAF